MSDGLVRGIPSGLLLSSLTFIRFLLKTACCQCTPVRTRNSRTCTYILLWKGGKGHFC